MEIEYTLEVEDLVAFQLNYMRNDPQAGNAACLGGSMVLFVVAVAAVLSGLTLAGGGKAIEAIVGFFSVLIPLLLLLVALRLLFPWITKIQVRAMYRGTEGRGQLCSRRVCLTAEGVGSVTQYTTESMHWPGVEKIVVTAAHVFFYTGPTGALVVPRRAFVSEEQFAEFIEQARRYHEAHQNLGPGIRP